MALRKILEIWKRGNKEKPDSDRFKGLQSIEELIKNVGHLHAIFKSPL